MSARKLLGLLQRRDVQITAVHDRLDIDAPPGELTNVDRDALRAHKAMILSLRSAPCLECGGPLPMGHLYRCHPCMVAIWWHAYQTAPPMGNDGTHADD
jgi:hypothetical protein